MDSEGLQIEIYINVFEAKRRKIHRKRDKENSPSLRLPTTGKSGM
jgi:hypothetical protein